MVRRNAEAELQLPPGFRFFPTDEELVVHYLCKKAASLALPVPIIAEVDLYKFDPWQLPEKALFGEKEWYFFTPRDRKYPNGSRPNRAAGTGYWKATGADKPITVKGGNKRVGIKKALVFYAGKAPKGTKTNWIMHEYRLADVNRPARKKGCLRLDDWVLCRIYNKKSSAEKMAMQQKESSLDETMDSFGVTDEKDEEILPALNSIEHSIEQTKSSFFKSSKVDPQLTNYNVMSSDDYFMKNNFSLQNPSLQQTTMAFNARPSNVSVQTPTVDPLPSSINQWANYNSADIISGNYTDSSCSKPSSSSEHFSEKEEVQSSVKMEAFSQGEQQHSFYNFDLEGLQNPFPQLDQITFSDSYQDYFTNVIGSDYLPRFCSNDNMLLQ